MTPRHPASALGIRDMAAVAPGIAAWGVMTGVAMVKSGLGLDAVLAMSIFVFAGSSQLAALPLFAAGAPVWMILATCICVNLRFVVFSAHLRPYVMHQPLGRRLLGAYLFADLSYVLFIRRFPQPATDPAGIAAQDAYWMANGLTAWITWTGSSLLGVALAASIPMSWGLAFAGVLALLGIAYSMVDTPVRAASALIASSAAVASFALPLKLNILVALAAGVASGVLLKSTFPDRRDGPTAAAAAAATQEPR